MSGVPGFPGALASDAAVVAFVGGGNAEVIELVGDSRAAPGVHGEVVIDTSDHVCGGDVSPHDGVVGDEVAVALWPGNGIAERDDAAGIAAFVGGAVHPLG